jgi:hypothetical protein
MSRTTGTFEFPANFEVKKQAPLDARLTTPLLSELTDSSLPFPYKGMVVAVTDDTTSSNNGLYQLIDSDDTDINNWERVGTGVGGGTIDGSGTSGNMTLWDGISTITDSVVTEADGIVSVNAPLSSVFNIALSSSLGEVALSAGHSATNEDVLYINSGFDAKGDSTVYGNLSVIGDFTYIDSTVSVTSALSVINTGLGPAMYVEQAGVGETIAQFKDTEGGTITITDGANINMDGGIQSNSVNTATVSATGRVDGSNISTIENKVEGLYSYLINNFDTNQITTATSLTDFVNNYPKTDLDPGDVITLSAINTAYILGDNDGSSNSDWLEVNLKPNFLFYRGNMSDYATLDCVPLSSAKSSKYIIQVEDNSDGALFYGEINVVSDGTIAVATEYALNHTTVFPFVEFGAEVVNGRVCLSAVALESKNMNNFTFKGNRSNLFG